MDCTLRNAGFVINRGGQRKGEHMTANYLKRTVARSAMDQVTLPLILRCLAAGRRTRSHLNGCAAADRSSSTHKRAKSMRESFLGSRLVQWL